MSIHKSWFSVEVKCTAQCIATDLTFSFLAGQSFARKFGSRKGSSRIISWAWKASIYLCWLGRSKICMLTLFVTRNTLVSLFFVVILTFAGKALERLFIWLVIRLIKYFWRTNLMLWCTLLLLHMWEKALWILLSKHFWILFIHINLCRISCESSTYAQFLIFTIYI